MRLLNANHSPVMAICHQVLIILATIVVVSAATDTNANDLVDLTNYHVYTNVESRLLQTTIEMTFRRRDDVTIRLDADPNSNSTNSSSVSQCGPIIHTMTLQLPRLARVQSLDMDLSDGCQLNSQVKGLQDAEDTFDNMVSEGKPAALLTAWDMSNYKLQIVLPPPSNTSEPTTVRLTYTELLVQRNHQVDFQLPLFPGIAVSDSLQVDLTIQDSHAGILELNLLNEQESGNLRKLMSNPFNVTQLDSKRVTAYFQERNLPEDSSLPRLLRGFFLPASLPEAGVLTIPFQERGEEKEEVCFTHVFNPSEFLASAGSLPKNMVFVIDVSGSMNGDRLANAKVAFVSMVSALANEKDSFAVQTFSTSGTESFWGPSVANPTSKQEATQFVQGLETLFKTNLRDAYLDGIHFARSMTSGSMGVPILVVLSDGEATEGIQDRKTIARDVLAANEGGQVKIFSLAFGSSADVDLLTGIALLNGGKVLQIYEGYDDSILQMEDFFQKELEQIVLSDIDINYFKVAGSSSVGVASAAILLPLSILDATSSSFPVMADGSELVIRGKVPRSELPLGDSNLLQASISALSAVGNQDWEHQYDLSLADLDNGDTGNRPLIVNDCEQSFAHARIEELLNIRNAQRALGNDIPGTVLSGSASIEEKARQIAIDAQLVWPGLTALVTVENPDCQQLLPSTETEEADAPQVCFSGESGNGVDDWRAYEEDDPSTSTPNPNSCCSGPPGGGSLNSKSDSSASGLLHSWWFLSMLLSLLFMLLH